MRTLRLCNVGEREQHVDRQASMLVVVLNDWVPRRSWCQFGQRFDRLAKSKSERVSSETLMSEVWDEPINYDGTKESFFSHYAPIGPRLEVLWEFSNMSRTMRWSGLATIASNKFSVASRKVFENGLLNIGTLSSKIDRDNSVAWRRTA